MCCMFLIQTFCRRAIDRAELAEKNLKGIEEELQTVGENMKTLEKSAEKAVEREEKLKEKIFSIQNKVRIDHKLTLLKSFKCSVQSC